MECLFIDDGSPDGTSEIITKNEYFNSKVFLINRESKKGYASACIEGFKWTFDKDYNFIIQMDADFSHSFEDLINLQEYAINYDLVIGSRYIDGGKTLGWNLFRTYLSKYANVFARLMTRSDIRDLTSGFRIYSAKIIEKINFEEINSEGYGFLVEVLDKIIHKNFSIKEVPITFNDRKFGESKMSGSVIYDGIKTTIKIGYKNYKLN